MRTPQARRASLSGYVEAGKLLPWRWAEERLVAARNYWVTTHARGYPSSRPVWGVWRDGTLIFSTGSKIGRNIDRDARVQVNLESGDEVVLLEGRAVSAEPATIADWAEMYNRKYHWDVPPDMAGVYLLLPTRALGWISDSSGLDHGAQFSNSATEWRFTDG